jgi:hypothetical protein
MTNRCLFCGGDTSEPGHRWHCDGRQGVVEAVANRQPLPVPVRRAGRTRTTAEAMTLLQQTRKRLIESGRMIARDQIAQTGSTHSRRVREEMRRRGLLDASVAGDYWLGAVFNCDEFEWTGAWHKHHSSERNIHERMVKVWTLRGGRYGVR